jgi:hypothetical protein
MVLPRRPFSSSTSFLASVHPLLFCFSATCLQVQVQPSLGGGSYLPVVFSDECCPSLLQADRSLLIPVGRVLWSCLSGAYSWFMAGPLTASIIVDASFEATACSRPRRSGSTCWCCVCCLVPLVDGEALPEFLLLLIWALLSLGADRWQGLWPERRSETLPCLSTVASLASINH